MSGCSGSAFRLLRLGREAAGQLVGIGAPATTPAPARARCRRQHDRGRRRRAAQRRSAIFCRSASSVSTTLLPGLRRRFVLGPPMTSRMSVLGRPRRRPRSFEAVLAAQVAVPLPLDAGAADEIAGAVALLLAWCAAPRPTSRSCSRARAPPSARTDSCGAPRHDLDARADRRRSRSTPSPRARCPRTSIGAGASALAGVAASRSQTSIAWSPFDAQERPQPREHIGFTKRGVTYTL